MSIDESAVCSDVFQVCIEKDGEKTREGGNIALEARWVDWIRDSALEVLGCSDLC